MENTNENVENYRKSGVFAWKTVGIYVEKNNYVEKQIGKSRKNVVLSTFQGRKVKARFAQRGYGKNVDKNFLAVGKYVENVTKWLEIVIFRAFQMRKPGFGHPYLVLTY
jgi:hypothetical protein